MVGFTIVNLREVHLNVEVRLMPLLHIVDVLTNISDLAEKKNCAAVLRTKNRKPAEVAECHAVAYPKGASAP